MTSYCCWNISLGIILFSCKFSIIASKSFVYLTLISKRYFLYHSWLCSCKHPNSTFEVWKNLSDKNSNASLLESLFTPLFPLPLFFSWHQVVNLWMSFFLLFITGFFGYLFSYSYDYYSAKVKSTYFLYSYSVKWRSIFYVMS